LTDFYGNITSETSKIITQAHGTGDVSKLLCVGFFSASD
jgi:hypothetical protein